MLEVRVCPGVVIRVARGVGLSGMWVSGDEGDTVEGSGHAAGGCGGGGGVMLLTVGSCGKGSGCRSWSKLW